MRILGACIFSKSFGGKIGVFWTANTNFSQKKKRGNLVWAPVFFLSLLAGKLNPFNQMLP